METILDIENNYTNSSCTQFTMEEEDWPEPGRLENNLAYGNYIVASRKIEEGDLVIQELPLFSTTFGTSDRLPFCLTCSKDLALSERCEKCKWPICKNDSCENDPVHSDAECQIFRIHNIRPKGNLLDYTGVEVLRCLLLRTKDPEKFKKFLHFESHCESRKQSPTDMADTEYIINFIQHKCQLREFDSNLIHKIIGVFAVNTFWAYRDIKRYASLLFEKTSMIAHDCDPNTKREILEKDVMMNGKLENIMYIRITAARTIEEGEPITIYYTTISDPVKKRQNDLKEIFYFECRCKRCLRELLEDNIEINGNI